MVFYWYGRAVVTRIDRRGRKSLIRFGDGTERWVKTSDLEPVSAWTKTR